MTETIKIPKFLEDREPLGERLSRSRKKLSKKMARYIADITFDKSSVEVAEYDEDNPDKYEQDLAFSSYESNLRHNHFETQQQKLQTQKRKIGSYIMMTPGLNAVAEHIMDSQLSRKRVKQQSKSYYARNGTFKSNLRKKYVAHVKEFSE